MPPAEILKAVLGVITPGLISYIEKRRAANAERIRKLLEAQKPPPRLLLAVEDDDNDVFLLTGYLKQTDVQYEIATDAQEAWWKFAERRHHIVMVDMRLPKVAGWDFAERVRRTAPSTFVIAMTGHEDGLRRLEKGQFYGVILKPITLESIEEMLSKIK